MTDGEPSVVAARAARLKQAQAAARERRFDEADGICRGLLGEFPDYAPALGLRGSIACSLGDLRLGVEQLEAAVTAQPTNLGLRSALCDAYRMACRLDEALVVALAVAQAQPRNVAFLVSLAKVHTDRGELDEALAVFMGVLAIRGDEANAHFGIAQILLARGEFRAGWIEYGWRTKLDEHKRAGLPQIRAPLWNGMRIPKGRVLLICDQGFGDIFQFARFIPMVAERCREVVVAATDDVRELLEGVEGVSRVFNQWTGAPAFSAYCLLSELPYLFGTELETIPKTVPYLRPSPDKAARWSRRLAELPERRRRVGLCWSGRPTHANNVRRSMALADLLPVAAVGGVQVISLQQTILEADRATMKAGWPDLIDASAELTDFSETAALIANLDLVITVDSAVGHLAGAAGAPVWLMLASPSDWRWLLPPQEDTPWYPATRLFRQQRPGRWSDVVDRITRSLRGDHRSPEHDL